MSTPNLFVSRAQYDYLTENHGQLLDDLIETATDRLWTLSGCHYYHAPPAIAACVQSVLENYEMCRMSPESKVPV